MVSLVGEDVAHAAARVTVITASHGRAERLGGIDPCGMPLK